MEIIVKPLEVCKSLANARDETPSTKIIKMQTKLTDVLIIGSGFGGAAPEPIISTSVSLVSAVLRQLPVAQRMP